MKVQDGSGIDVLSVAAEAVREVGQPAAEPAGVTFHEISGGLANHAVIASAGGQRALVRIEREPLREETRLAERMILSWGGEVQVTPRLFGWGITSGGVYYTVQEYLDGRHVTVEDFRNTELRRQLLRLLRQFQESGLVLPAVKGIFQRAAYFFELLTKAAVSEGERALVDDYRTFYLSVVPAAERIAATYSLPLVPVHNDLVDGNVLIVTANQMRLIDFHRSAMGLGLLDVVNAGRLFTEPTLWSSGIEAAADLYGVSATDRELMFLLAIGQYALSAGFNLTSGRPERYRMFKEHGLSAARAARLI